MDARIEAEAAVITLTVSPTVKVVTTAVGDLVIELVSLFDAASILASLLSQGLCSVSAVAPDYILEGEVSGLALVG